jgi:outer membrane protein assembly factor BamB
MATTTGIKTGGSSTTSVLSALQFGNTLSNKAVTGTTTAFGPSSYAPGATTGNQWALDIATMNALWHNTQKGDVGVGSTTINTNPVISQGNLYLPNRGFIAILPGDWIYADPTTGWMTVVPQYVVAAGSFIHS